MNTVLTSNIRLNSLGFLPFQRKRASIVIPCTTFCVINVNSSNAVFIGNIHGPVLNEDTEENIYIADFSNITEPGLYYLKIDEAGESVEFEISENIFQQPFRTVMLGMYLWRCGTSVSACYNGETFTHSACHLQDGFIDYWSDGFVQKMGVGGWHDAGDYNKYVVNAAITLFLMFMAWEQFGDKIKKIEHLPEGSEVNSLPDYLQEIKWEIDWLFTMQFEDGSVSHKLSAKQFCGFIMPEQETEKRYFSQWGSTATADFTAIMAAASRIFRIYDQDYADCCIEAAKKSYSFLSINKENHMPDLSEFKTGNYATNDMSHRLWASAELWEATGEEGYLKDFEQMAGEYSEKIESNFSWNNLKNLGMIRYLLSKRAGRKEDLVGQISSALIKTADLIAETGATHGYGRTLGNFYCWGANGNLLNQVLLFQCANFINPGSSYINASLDAIGYIFGRNHFGRSFVTGVGFNPPQNPHDRRSSADDIKQPWPGYLVGGPEKNATDYHDIEDDCRTNEIAINWNASLIYALAGFIN